jgi:methyl-accepting chemotaxis protein
LPRGIRAAEEHCCWEHAPLPESGGLLGEVLQTAFEQSAKVSSVGSAVQQLDQMTQQNSALVEQAVAAVAGLRDQAVELADEVAAFKMSA